MGERARRESGREGEREGLNEGGGAGEKEGGGKRKMEAEMEELTLQENHMIKRKLRKKDKIKRNIVLINKGRSSGEGTGQNAE